MLSVEEEKGLRPSISAPLAPLRGEGLGVRGRSARNNNRIWDSVLSYSYSAQRYSNLEHEHEHEKSRGERIADIAIREIREIRGSLFFLTPPSLLPIPLQHIVPGVGGFMFMHPTFLHSGFDIVEHLRVAAKHDHRLDRR